MDKKYYAPEACKEKIRDFFIPVYDFWVIMDYAKNKAEGKFSRADEITIQQSRVHAQQSHDEMCHFINQFPIDGDRYTLLLIYEKLYAEMFKIRPDENYDYAYLCDRFMHCLDESKY